MKNIIKSLLSVFYFLNKKKVKEENIISIPNYLNTFFGYYDVSSFNEDETDIILHGEKVNGEVDIVCYNIHTKLYEVLDSTLAWNYQQGARTMWYTNQEIIYNKYDNKEKTYYSVIKNINDLSEKKIGFPVQTLYKNDYFLSIDYYELHTLKTEYGYSNKSSNSKFGNLYKYSLSDNTDEILFDIKDCLALLKEEYEEIKKNHFNHFLINKTGDYFIFIFRFYTGDKRIDSLLGYSFNENKLELLIENQLISHSTWKDKNTFVFWGGIDNIKGYYEFKLTDKRASLKIAFEYDGHPTFISKNTILTDTYPNKFLSEKLFILNIETGKTNVLKEFKHPAKYEAYNRCDLHPSMAKSKNKYQVDFMHKGKRSVYVDFVQNND